MLEWLGNARYTETEEKDKKQQKTDAKKVRRKRSKKELVKLKIKDREMRNSGERDVEQMRKGEAWLVEEGN